MTQTINKALVTGASGFLGTALCEELSGRGVEVIAVVREASDAEYIGSMKNVRVVRCDMADYKTLPEKIADRDVDVFFHLAWRGSSGAERGDKDIQLANISCSCDAARACSAMRCQRFMFASSFMEFEIAEFMSGEGNPPKSSIYQSAKLAANYMLRAEAASVGIVYLRAVISNVYGPGEISPRLINSSLRKIARGERCSFSPGEQIYDFIYITDAARAFIAIAEYGVPNRTYYIGSENPRPLKEFLTEMGEAAGTPELIGLGDLTFSGVAADYSKIDVNVLSRDTGFKFSVDFKNGIIKTFEWIKNNSRR